MFPIRHLPTLQHWCTAAAIAALTACGGSSDDPSDDEHDHTHIETAGRLALAEAGQPRLHLHDLDLRQTEKTHTLDNPASSLYASPGGRYVVALQGSQDQVQLVDGGLWQEDHGDHLHDYQQASSLLAWKVQGIQPSHFNVQADRQATLFFDGRATASTASPATGNAGVHLLTDASIGAAQTVASLALSAPVHGLAVPWNDQLLAVDRASDALDALPTHLQLHRRNGSGYTLDRTLATRCDRMHGGASTGSHTAVGCADGVLLVQHVDSGVSDRKVTTTERVSTLVAHPTQPGHFIAIGNAGTPSTTRFFAVDASAAGDSATEIVPQGWTSGRLRRAHAFDRSGQFHILDDQGTWYVLRLGASGWTTETRTEKLITDMPTAAPFPVLASSGARDELYLTDPRASSLITLNTQARSVQQRTALGFTPALATWVGIAR